MLSFLSPCFNKDSPLLFLQTHSITISLSVHITGQNTVLNVCRASPRLLITCHSGDLNVRIQPAAVMLVDADEWKLWTNNEEHTGSTSSEGYRKSLSFSVDLDLTSDTYKMNSSQLKLFNCSLISFIILLIQDINRFIRMEDMHIMNYFDTGTFLIFFASNISLPQSGPAVTDAVASWDVGGQRTPDSTKSPGSCNEPSLQLLSSPVVMHFITAQAAGA